MKFPPFQYHAPATSAEAIAILAADPEAKLLAGGQSLLPLLALRLAYPTALVDLAGVEGLRGLDTDGRAVRIGAMETLTDVGRSDIVGEKLPLVSAAIAHVAHEPIRNRGTFGGNLAHADPASELPAVMVALDAQLVLQGPAGERRVAAGEFWRGPFTTALGADEILTCAEVPVWQGGWSFHEAARRSGDFALVLVAAGIESANGTCSAASLCLHGVAGAPVRARAAEKALVGGAVDEALAEEAAELATAELTPTGDVHCTSDGRRKIARTLVRRAVLEAGGSVQ